MNCDQVPLKPVILVLAQNYSTWGVGRRGYPEVPLHYWVFNRIYDLSPLYSNSTPQV